MPTALLSSHKPNVALNDFAIALISQGWTIITDPTTNGFLATAGVRNISVLNLDMLGDDLPIFSPGLQIGLVLEDTAENRSLGNRLIDLAVVDFRPLKNVLIFSNRSSVFMETMRAWVVMAAIVGSRPVVTDPGDLERVLGWIERDELAGLNLRWLWAKATTTLALRMTELAKYVSFGTSPGGMLIGIGLPDPDSPEWAKVCARQRDAVNA